MEFKKELTPVIGFSDPTVNQQAEVRQYGVLRTNIRATYSGSPASNFKVLSRVLSRLNAAGMRSDQIQLPEGQGYQVTEQTGVVSLKSTEPSSGIIASADKTVVYQIVPDSENILGSGQQQAELVSMQPLPKGSERLVVKMTVVEPIRLPELEKAA